MKNILWTKIDAARCVIQSYSSVITEKFTKIIIAYSLIVEDAWRWVINSKRMFKSQYASYKYITHKSINPNFFKKVDIIIGGSRIMFFPR